MFSSHNKLKRKTPEQGINREQFIKHLVEEYYTTTNIEAQEQVTANLANFAYDPINWNYLKAADGLELFLELLETPDENLQLHGAAGLCNICLEGDQRIVNITCLLIEEFGKRYELVEVNAKPIPFDSTTG